MKYWKTSRGFSLIELLLVIGIFVTITTIGLAGFSTFHSKTLLTNLAYDIALSVREAQFYSISVRSEDPSGPFARGYGVHFLAGELGRYVLFYDSANTTADLKYAGDFSCDSGDTECVEVFELRAPYFISDVCGTKSALTRCFNSSSWSPSHFDIAFERPNPEAVISSNFLSGYDQIEIILSSGTDERTVTVYSTGQVSVSQ